MYFASARSPRAPCGRRNQRRRIMSPAVTPLRTTMGEPHDLDDLIKNMHAMGENLTNAAGTLGTNVQRGADRMAEAIEKAAAASNRYAGRLAFATWTLVAVTVALVIVTGLDAYLAYTGASALDED